METQKLKGIKRDEKQVYKWEQSKIEFNPSERDEQSKIIWKKYEKNWSSLL